MRFGPMAMQQVSRALVFFLQGRAVHGDEPWMGSGRAALGISPNLTHGSLQLPGVR